MIRGTLNKRAQVQPLGQHFFFSFTPFQVPLFVLALFGFL